MQLASKCGYCSSPHRESSRHVFITHDVAHAVWKHFEDVIAVKSNASHLQLKLNGWCQSKMRSPSFKEILSSVPVCIFWELWKFRNKSRFDGLALDVRILIQNVHEAIRTAFTCSALRAKRCSADESMLRDLGVQCTTAVSKCIITR